MAIPLATRLPRGRSGATPCPYANPRFSCAFTLGALAHLYVGARLIPDGLHHGPSAAAAVLALALSCIPIPLGMLARSRRGRPGATGSPGSG